MKMIFASVLGLCVIEPAQAFTPADLSAALDCHKAVLSFSEGRSQKLDFDEKVATPLMISSGGNIYVYSNKTAYSVKNVYQGKKVAVRIQEQGKAFESEIEIGQKAGEFGNKSTKVSQGVAAMDLKETTNDAALNSLYDEIAARLSTVKNNTGFRYKYGLITTQVTDALRKCQDIASKKVAAAAQASLSTFEAPAGKGNKSARPVKSAR
ncbi:MAG: hypothetical protein EOP09_18905 [Proteobacteria bacterium]|nr:MAG: hypothetical protein EOP09_18905 [Pseudomonadota bacterium]